MDPGELRKRAAWLDAGAIRFAHLDVAALLRRYANEARAKADALELGAARPSTPSPMPSDPVAPPRRAAPPKPSADTAQRVFARSY